MRTLKTTLTVIAVNEGDDARYSILIDKTPVAWGLYLYEGELMADTVGAELDEDVFGDALLTKQGEQILKAAEALIACGVIDV